MLSKFAYIQKGIFPRYGLSCEPYNKCLKYLSHHHHWGQKVKIHFFSEHDHVAYRIKEIYKCSNMVANILTSDPPPPPLGMGPVDQNSTFTELGHVAYQIKEKHDCSNMAANILPADPLSPPPPDPVVGVSSSKFNFFSTWSGYISN